MRAKPPLPNGDRVCWYCGSWDREQFVAYLRKILSGEVSATYTVEMEPRPLTFGRLSLSDRRHKIYVRQDGVRNAGEGAIKVYVAHLTQDDCDLVNEVLRLGERGTQ